MEKKEGLTLSKIMILGKEKWIICMKCFQWVNDSHARISKSETYEVVSMGPSKLW